jgi:hypothetical protein
MQLQWCLHWQDGKISPAHGFWAEVIADVFEQTETNRNINTIVQRLMVSKELLTPCCDLCCTVTKSFCNALVASGPFIETSLMGNKYKTEQVSVNSFFCRNPTLARIAIIDEDNNLTKKKAQIPIHGTSAYADAAGGGNVPKTADVAPPAATIKPLCHPWPKTAPTHWQQLKLRSLASSLRPWHGFQFSAPQQPPKNVVGSQDHKESANLAKL